MIMVRIYGKEEIYTLKASGYMLSLCDYAAALLKRNLPGGDSPTSKRACRIPELALQSPLCLLAIATSGSSRRSLLLPTSR